MTLKPPPLPAAWLGCLAVSLTLTSAPPAFGAARECFFASELSNWTATGGDVVHLRVGVRDVYELKLVSSCPDLPYAEHIGVETRGGSSHICTGLDLNLIVPRSATHSIPMRCMGVNLRKLTPDEAKALPAKLRP
jgi:hypothetical protein